MDTALFTKQGKYLMLALDHRASFLKFLNPQKPEAVTQQQAIEAKRKIIEPIINIFSGILIDPDYGLPAYKQLFKDKQTYPPYLLCIEKSGCREDKTGKYTELEYTAKNLRSWGASGVKLLLHFNPLLKSAEHQLKTGKKAIEDAHNNNLPVFLEIVTYESGSEKIGRSNLVLKSLEMFIANNIIPDVWKLEYPGNIQTCQKITQIVGQVPWILLTRGEKYPIFKQQLQDAVSAGAKGFLAGRALWQEAAGLTDNKLADFLKNTLLERFKEINKIVIEG